MTTIPFVGADRFVLEVEHELATAFEIDARIETTAGACHLLARARANEGRAVVIHAFARRVLREHGCDERLGLALDRWREFSHPLALELVAHGATASLRWCATESPAAPTLADELATRGALGTLAALGIVEQLAAVLAAAHLAGLTHGGLRAAHAVRERDGRVRVGGFAVAAVLDRLAGVATDPDSASGDQAALARLFRTMLAGRHVSLDDPETGATAASPPMREVLARAEHPVSAQRYPDVATFVSSLRAAHRATAERRASTTPQRLLFVDPPRGAPLRRAALIAVVILVAALQAQRVLAPELPTTSRAATRVAHPDPSPPPQPRAEPEADPAATVVQSPPEEIRPPAPRRPEPPSDPVRAAEVHSAGVGPAKSRPVEVRRPAEPPPIPREVAVRTPVAAPSSVGVSARPWGHLYIDDRYIGETPVASVPVAPGRHVIRVVRAGYHPVERAVVVSAGEALRVTDIELQREIP